MPEGWKTYKLEEITAFKSGKTRPATEGIFPVYGGNGIMGHANEFNSQGETIIIGRVGAYCGSVYYENRLLWVSDNALIALPKNGENVKFLYYLLNLLGLNRFAQGSSHPLLTQTILNDIPITIPLSIIEQSRIASILSSLDDKIELNLQMNKTLEAIAQTIFKEWFVDFRFPGFDGVLVEGLPEGWKRGKLSDVIDVKGGATPSTNVQEYWEGTFHWATPKDLSSSQSPVLLSTERSISKEGVKQIGSGVLPQGTLLLSSRAPIGYLAISQVPISINQGFIAIQGRTLSNLFMLFWLNLNMDLVKSRANGSTFQEISKSNFKEIDITIPSTELLTAFDNFVNPIFEKIVANVIQNQTLTVTRDSLLPKLMTGKIRVA